MSIKKTASKPEYSLHDLEVCCANAIKRYNTLVTKLNTITNSSHPLLNYNLNHTTPLKFNLERNYLIPMTNGLEASENE